MRDVGLWRALALVSCLVGCGDSDASPPKTECDPGETVECSCAGDEEGEAVCDDDGEAGTCMCADEATDDDDEGDDDDDDAEDARVSSPADTGTSRPNGNDASMARVDGGARDAAADTAVPAARNDASTPTEPTGPSNPPGAADPAKNGPYPPMTEQNVGPGMAFTLVRPRELGANGIKHPVITWGNGTGTTPTAYTALLNRLASHGFVVIASNNTNTGSGMEMLQGVDWVLEQSRTQGSPMFEKIDANQIGATGHSQGGFGTCQTARDPRIKTIAPIQGFRTPMGFAGSTFAISGGMDTIVAPTGISSGFDRVQKGPAMYGELKAATHTDWLRGSNATGAAYFEAVTAWMRVHLMADSSLRSKFYTAQCGYCGDSAWTVKRKDMDQ
jgi:hypothetical protein